jgi:hypothetical protein
MYPKLPDNYPKLPDNCPPPLLDKKFLVSTRGQLSGTPKIRFLVEKLLLGGKVVLTLERFWGSELEQTFMDRSKRDLSPF